ncbi:MAG: T9SS type A sorting domain-containing protein [Saprospiraceae bacterium]|nr:T9SS type A sorting domain-containing protein [Saprospiraceae bacterium]
MTTNRSIRSAVAILLFLWASAPVFGQWEPLSDLYAFEKITLVNKTLIATASHRVYRSEDLGATWTNVTPAQPCTVFKLVQDSASVFLVTKEGIWQSTDAANTWQALPHHINLAVLDNLYDVEVADGYLYFSSPTIPTHWGAILRQSTTLSDDVDTISVFKNTIWGYNPKLIRQGNSLLAYDVQHGILRFETADSCQCPVYSTVAYTFPVYQMVVDGDRWLVRTDLDWKRSLDAGETWQTLGALPAADWVKASDGALFSYAQGGKLMVSENFGDTWNPLWQFSNTSIKATDALWLDDRILACSSDGFLQTTDKGASWLAIAVRQSTYSGPYLYALPDALFRFGNQFSYDGGRTWAGRPDTALAGGFDFVRFFQFKGKTYGHMQYFGYYVTDPGDYLHWTRLGGNWPFSTEYSVPHQNFIYNKDFQNNKLYRSPDGNQWTLVVQMPWGSLDPVSHQGRLFVPNTDYSLMVSDDEGYTWTQVFLGAGNMGWPNGGRLLSEGDRLYLYDRTRILVSADNGQTWTRVNHNLIDLDGTPAVVADFTVKDQNLFVVTNQGIFQSYGNTDAWWNITGNLPSSDNNQLYYGYYELDVYGDELFVSRGSNGIEFKRQIAASAPAWVEGYLFLDLNHNTTWEPGEPPLSGLVVTAGPQAAVSRADGHFSCPAAPGDQVKPVLPLPGMLATPEFWPADAPDSLKNFGITLAEGSKNWSVTATQQSVFRSGFEETIQVSLSNLGAVDTTGVLRFTPDPQLQYLWANPMPDLVDGATLVWNIPSLPFLQNQHVQIRFRTAQTALLGDSIFCLAAVQPAFADEAPANNQYLLRGAVRNAYDPNDKRVEPEDFIQKTAVETGKPLEYSIRFQNTGNYSANLVRIVDTLVPQIDPRSVQLLAASHPCVWRLIGSNVLEFSFPGIEVPDSAASPLGSQGFVRFAVQVRKNTPVGAQWRNTAYIYFDFNPPVQTNSVQTEVQWIIAVHEQTPLEHRLQLSPNPARQRVQVRANSDALQQADIRLLDASGRLLRSTRLQAGVAWLDVQALPRGQYWVSAKGQAGATASVLLLLE